MLAVVGLFFGAVLAGTRETPAADSQAAKADPIALGREIFDREWLPGDGRTHGGDGLGPVFNDTSCVSCHNAGGAGGGGPISKNIDILSASSPRGVITMNGEAMSEVRPLAAKEAKSAGSGEASVADPRSEPLFGLHAGFRNGKTVVLHKFGIDPTYQTWRRKLLAGGGTNVGVPGLNSLVPIPAQSVPDFAESVPQPTEPFPVAPIADTTVQFVAVRGNLTESLVTGVSESGQNVVATATVPPATSPLGEGKLQAALATIQRRPQASVIAGEFTVSHSQRNPTSLFGIGLLDSIPEAAIIAAEEQSRKNPGVQGRASRLKDGRIGRLGWKGQIASVNDFVLTACAVELGLEVPGHQQALSPQAPKYRAEGNDLTGEECSALVAYVNSIPRPVERVSQALQEIEAVSTGKNLFANAGCASCHAPKLGEVDGVYSDLLLHDMGADMADSGSYGDDDSSDPLNPVLGTQTHAKAGAQDNRPATRQEWRTPPLWGFRDSAPYLHDGRAETLDQAVAGHGGQGRAAALRYFSLSVKEKVQLEAFLKSLVAPGAAGVAVATK